MAEVNEFVYRLLAEGNGALARLLRANLIPTLAVLHPPKPAPLPVSAKVLCPHLCHSKP